MAISVGNVTTSGTAIYTSSGNSAVTFSTLTNYTGSSVSVDVHVVPNGGSAGNSNIIIANLTISAEDTHQIYSGGEKLLLGNGDFISVTANSNNAITSVTSYTGV